MFALNWQWSQIFLVPGTDLVEDIIHAPGVGDGSRRIQVHYIYYTLCLESNVAANLTGGTSPQPGGWGSLL